LTELLRNLSSDLIRQLLYDNAGDQHHPEWVFAVLRDLLRRRLEAGAQTTYIDATNLTRYLRRSFLQIAREFGCAAEALYFDVPLEVCLQRNRNRRTLNSGVAATAAAARQSRVVPEEVMSRMAGRLQPPTKEEGFSRIVVLRSKRQKSPSGAKR
jgi:predicted kinase